MVESQYRSSHLEPLHSPQDQVATETADSPDQPPIPIGVYKITDELPIWLHKRPSKVPSVRSAVHKVRPHIAPEKVRRVVSEDGTENEYEGLLFYHKRKPKWFIIPPEKKIEPLDTPFIMNGAGQALSIRQDQARPVPPTQDEITAYLYRHPEEETHLGLYEVAHDAQEIFTLAVWHWLRKELLEEETPPVKEAPSRCFREVYLNNYGVIYDREIPQNSERKGITCGQVDVYGTLPDNQGVIIDFGSVSKFKELQVMRQALGTKAVIEESNHLESPPITTLIGEYFQDDNGINVIHLQNTRHYHPRSNIDSSSLKS